MKMTKDYRLGIIWKSVGISIILHEFYKNSSFKKVDMKAYSEV